MLAPSDYDLYEFFGKYHLLAFGLAATLYGGLHLMKYGFRLITDLTRSGFDCLSEASEAYYEFKRRFAAARRRYESGVRVPKSL